MKISEIIDTYMKNQEKIDVTNEKLKILRDNNKKLSETIINFMEEQKKNEISYKHNSFEKKYNKNHSVISQKLLKDSLTQYFENNNFDKTKVEDLINYILNNRTTTTKTELKMKLNS